MHVVGRFGIYGYVTRRLLESLVESKGCDLRRYEKWVWYVRDILKKNPQFRLVPYAVKAIKSVVAASSTDKMRLRTAKIWPFSAAMLTFTELRYWKHEIS